MSSSVGSGRGLAWFSGVIIPKGPLQMIRSRASGTVECIYAVFTWGYIHGGPDLGTWEDGCSMTDQGPGYGGGWL